MMDQNLKEFKYRQCFISDRAASCNRCGIRSWKKGHKVYGFKKPDGKWSFCTDRKCYLAQGGKLTVFKTTMEQPKTVTEPQDSQTVSRCPVCNGNGLVSNGFYNQTSGLWSSSSTEPEKCRSCNGHGFVTHRSLA